MPKNSFAACGKVRFDLAKMFWKFPSAMSTTIDALLDRDPPCSLRELLQDPDILQECKTKNEKLTNRLTQNENIKQMIEFVTRPDPNLGAEVCEKLALNATEIITCEQLEVLADAILKSSDLMRLLLSLPERLSPLNPLYTSYWARIMSRLLGRNVPEALDHIYSYDHFLEKLLNHTATSAVADFVMKLLSVEDLPGGRGIGRWLQENGLVRALVNQLDPFLNPEHHSTATFILLEMISVSYNNAMGPDALETLANGETSIWGPSAVEQYMTSQTLAQLGHEKTLADESALVNELKSKPMMELLAKHMLTPEAPYSASTFANATSIIIELIRKYCTEVEQCEFLHHQASQPQPDGSFPVRPPSLKRIAALGTYLADLLEVLAVHFGSFSQLLLKPRNLPELAAYTHGTVRPLGPERYKACELFAEVLHLQYLVASSPLFESLLKSKADLGLTDGSITPVERDSEDSTVSETPEQPLDQRNAPTVFVIEKLIDLTLLFVQHSVLPTSIELFFEYEWNNFLHSVVYDMIAKIANTYAFCTSSPAPTPNLSPDATVGKGISIDVNQRPSVFMARLQRNIRLLVLDIFVKGKLTSRMCEAQRKNDFSISQERGYRLGHMGHLTYIADEVLKLIEKCGPGDLHNDLRVYLDSEEWVQYVQGPLKETKERDRLVLDGDRPDNKLDSNGFLGDSMTGAIGFSEDGEGLATSALSHMTADFSKHYGQVSDSSSAAEYEAGPDSDELLLLQGEAALPPEPAEMGMKRRGSGDADSKFTSETRLGQFIELEKDVEEKLSLKSLPSLPNSADVGSSESPSSSSPTAAAPTSSGPDSVKLSNLSSVEEDQLGRYIVQSVISSMPVDIAGDENLDMGELEQQQSFPAWLSGKAAFVKSEEPIHRSSPTGDETSDVDTIAAIQQHSPNGDANEHVSVMDLQGDEVGAELAHLAPSNQSVSETEDVIDSSLKNPDSDATGTDGAINFND